MIEEYMLASLDRVESVRRRLLEKTRKNEETGCVEWTAKARAFGGYGVLCVGRAGQIRAHRAAWVLAKGPIPSGLYVCHRCDNPLCCNVDHLFLGTPAENMTDKVTKGRGVKPPTFYGEAHHNTKITAAQAKEISCAPGTLDEVAKQYGISSKTVWRIRKGLTWKRIKLTSEPSTC